MSPSHQVRRTWSSAIWGRSAGGSAGTALRPGDGPPCPRRLVGEHLRRRRPAAVVPGALVDWWRVALVGSGELVLRSVGWFPGDAWLGYRARQGALHQVAAFRPRGIPGFFTGNCSRQYTAWRSTEWPPPYCPGDVSPAEPAGMKPTRPQPACEALNRVVSPAFPAVAVSALVRSRL